MDESAKDNSARLDPAPVHRSSPVAGDSVNTEAPDIQRDTRAEHPSWAAGWGQLLRTARQITGLSLNQLSTITGLSKSYLSKLESGASGAANPSRATLAALARALPSFRPLAHTLEPGTGTAELDYRGMLAPASAPLPSASPAVPRPIELGWRELEALVALLSLESAALPFSITPPVLARATGRDVATIARTMDRLMEQRLVESALAASAGGVVVYRCADDALARLGVVRLGDLLVLAAALFAGASAGLAVPRSTIDRPAINSHRRTAASYDDQRTTAAHRMEGESDV